MQDLEKVVDKVREDLKALYLSDQHTVWHHPFVVMIQDDDIKVLEGAKTPDQLIEWLVSFRGPNQMKGVVVGRMVAKYSKTIRDANGDPQVLERAILVSGRMLDTSQTLVSITPCREHKDMRLPDHGEPVKGRPYIPGLNSPDKVDPLLNELGQVAGFKEIQFGEDQIFDSRKGDKCMLDPIIEGVISMPAGPGYVQ